MSTRVGTPLIANLEGGGHLHVKRFDSLSSPLLSLGHSPLSRGFPSRLILYYASVAWKWQ
jgi:hypothetical protein